MGEEAVRSAGPLTGLDDRKSHREELRRDEERYRLVARATGEAIWDNDLLTGKQEWDGATQSLFGYPLHVGRTGAWWEERIHPDDRGRVLRGLRNVLDSEDETWEEEYRFRRADGSYSHVADRGCVVRNEEGQPIRMVGSMADVTERKRYEEELVRSEQLFRTTFEAAAVGIAHLAPDGCWLRVNERLCEISGYRRDELLRMSYLDLTLPEDLAARDEHLRRLLDGETGPYCVERRYVRKDGSRVWVNLSVSLVRAPSGRPDYIVCVAEDTTACRIEELVTDPLTPRELRVLESLATGLTDPQISRSLSHSLGTVKLEVRHILAKLRVGNRKRAATRAVEIGLISPASSQGRMHTGHT